MSGAAFGFDKKIDEYERASESANGIPARVIQMMTETQRERARPSIRQMYDETFDLKHIEMWYDYALFIRGTTDEIVKARQKDHESGIKYFSVLGDTRLDIRFIR
ncbi:hypothetical protein [Paracoccus litorisediminis]|uniref:Uncharacterized protein n=1 Tax=Paracoccus litorisediminis TaxID=2006130 RepID=A0A844HLU5_9RHOB|nr:hypothetical protein [Paracoccus litorisediminis]MTH61253.1 hypothetical protein [Paracoccus litorisediminis]